MTLGWFDTWWLLVFVDYNRFLKFGAFGITDVALLLGGVCWLSGWLAGWLAGWLPAWLTVCLSIFFLVMVLLNVIIYQCRVGLEIWQGEPN